MIEEVGMFVSTYMENRSSVVVNHIVKLQLAVCSRLIEIQRHKFCFSFNFLKQKKKIDFKI
jgi:hypothetical protein